MLRLNEEANMINVASGRTAAVLAVLGVASSLTATPASSDRLPTDGKSQQVGNPDSIVSSSFPKKLHDSAIYPIKDTQREDRNNGDAQDQECAHEAAYTLARSEESSKEDQCPAVPPQTFVGYKGKCLDVDGPVERGAKLVMNTCVGAASQKWVVSPAEDTHSGQFRIVRPESANLCVTTHDVGGQYQLDSCTDGNRFNARMDGTVYDFSSSTTSSYCLDVQGAATSDQTPVISYSCHGNENQQWGYPSNPIRGLASKCIDGNSANEDRKPVLLYTCNDQPWQKWRVLATGQIVTQDGSGNSRCMDVRDVGTADETKVQMYTCRKLWDPLWVAQQWAPKQDGSLFNPNSKKCLHVPGSATADVTELQIYTCNATAAQAWSPNPQPIVNKDSGKCLDIKGGQGGTVDNNTDVILYDCNSGVNQKWVFQFDGTIRSLSKCLDVFNGASSADSRLVAYDCNGSFSQSFSERVINGTPYLINMNSDMCIGRRNASSVDGTNIVLAECNQTSQQQWDIQSRGWR
ncbi:hypothetical protein HNR23_002203 [Nocardiopsis mwathae]|uniref:Ricin B lectin domain-containing protein n=1 Tax=Nocardiopsis mwathae TaxID=1472723 RepID=A0A7X0D5D8_9ACTN|nr:RICIN domain-containing protein [Nocardiopsis mwathae]MBB6172143.1 hypothetical protein [Nocardiopsis mwathae]